MNEERYHNQFMPAKLQANIFNDMKSIHIGFIVDSESDLFDLQLFVTGDEVGRVGHFDIDDIN